MENPKKVPAKRRMKIRIETLIILALTAALAFITYSNICYQRLNNELWQRLLKNYQSTSEVLEKQGSILDTILENVEEKK